MKNTLNFGAMPRAIVGCQVRADASDPKALVGQLNAAFEEFKAAQDEKLAAKVDDVVLENKINALNTAMSDIEAALNEKIASAAVSPVGDMPATSPEYMDAFKAHMRKGDVQAAMTVGTDADGGYLAPVEWDRTVTDALKQRSPIRENAQVITISGSGFSRVYNDGVVGSGWVGETAARPETATPGLTTLNFETGELYANPAISQKALDDVAINLEQWISDEVSGEFAVQENIAFLTGTGVNKPFGILTYVTGAANAAKHPFGAIATVDAGALTVDVDDVYNTIYDLPSERAGDAKWYMNRSTIAAFRKLKDADGNTIWQPSMQVGEPSTLGGYPLVEVPGMPEIAASAVTALFGNMAATYLVIDRIGLRVLRDPYTNKPFVHFYTTKRVGGGVQNPEHMRALKMSAT